MTTTIKTTYNVHINVMTYFGGVETFDNLKDAFALYKKCLDSFGVDIVVLSRDTLEITTKRKLFKTVTTTKVINSKTLLSWEF